MAILFDDASTEYLEMNTALITAMPFTMACWFNSNGAAGGQSLMWLGDKDSAIEHFALRATGGAAGDVQAYVRAAAGSSGAESTTTWSQNTWHHAAAVFASSSDIRAFIDGGSRGNDNPGLTPTGLDRFSIGRFGDNPSPSFYMSGLIAEAAMWAATLSDEEIAILGAGTSPEQVRPGSLVQYHRLLNINDLRNRRSADTLSSYGGTTGNHCRILDPLRGQFPLIYIEPTGISHKDTSTGIVTNGLVINIDIAVSGSNPVLVAKVALKSTSVTVTGVKWTAAGGDEAFTKLNSDRNGDAGSEIWYLANPTVDATADVQIDFSGTTRAVGAASLYNNVHQTTPFRVAGASSANGTDAAPTVDVVALDGEVVVDSLSQVSAGPDTAAGDHTERHNTAAISGGSDTRGASQEKASAGDTETMGWTMSDSDNWAICAGPLQEVVSAVNTINRMIETAMLEMKPPVALAY